MSHTGPHLDPNGDPIHALIETQDRAIHALIETQDRVLALGSALRAAILTMQEMIEHVPDDVRDRGDFDAAIINAECALDGHSDWATRQDIAF